MSSIDERVQKVLNGKCWIIDCNNDSDLYPNFPLKKPLLCYTHQSQAESTHSGEYLQSEKNSYYSKWTCCENIYKQVICPHFEDKFESLSVPIKEDQRVRVKAIEDRLQAEREYWERIQASYQNGHDESYDR